MSLEGRTILHVYKDYCPPVHGGMEKTVRILALGARAHGLHARVLVANPGRLRTRAEEVEGVSVVRVGEWGRLQSAPVCPSFPWWMRKLSRSADLLHFHFPNPTGEASFLLVGAARRCLVSYQSDIIRQRAALRFYRLAVRAFLRRMDVICPSTEAYVEGSEFLMPLAHKCRPVPLGIEARAYAEPPPRERVDRLRGRYGERFVLFVGHFRHYKGLHGLIEAVAPMEDVRLVLVGEGFLFHEVARRVRERALTHRVFLAGSVSEEELKAHFHACTLLVLPSTNRAEAFGLVLLEAMACGKPVISTELGTGTSYVNLHGRTGLVVPPSDVESLRAAIRRLLEDEGLRERFGREGQRRAFEVFSAEKMVKRYLEIYEELLGEG